MKPRLQEEYRKDVVPALMKRFDYDNVMMVPHFEKIAVNIGVGDAHAESEPPGGGGGDAALHHRTAALGAQGEEVDRELQAARRACRWVRW